MLGLFASSVRLSLGRSVIDLYYPKMPLMTAADDTECMGYNAIRKIDFFLPTHIRYVAQHEFLAPFSGRLDRPPLDPQPKKSFS